jgi:polar amino acid transport system substrate-binding protein
MTTRSRIHPLLVAMAALALVAVLAGCGSTAESTSGPDATAPTVLPEGATISTDTPTPDPPACLTSLTPAPGPVPAPGNPAAGPTVMAIRGRTGTDRALRVGVDQTTLNWGYLTPSGTIEGFDVDMLVKVATAIFGGHPVTDGTIHFIVVPNAERQTAVHSGKVDLLAETMTITCDRQQGADAVAFSSEYFHTDQGILAPKSTKITSTADLNGKRVCATKGSTSIRRLVAIGGVIPWGAATQTDCLVMLQQGQVDAISTDNTILAGFVQEDPNLEIKTDVTGAVITLRPEPYGMAIAPDHPDFVRFVNAVLAQDRTNPNGWAATYTKWLCPAPQPSCAAPQPPTPTYEG